MKNDNLYDYGYYIYPGVYVPLKQKEEAEVKCAITHHHDGDTILPPVTITELDQLYKVELNIPNVKRENFLIYADNNILSVCLVNVEHRECEGEKPPRQLFSYECFNQPVILPENADAEYASASYNAGTLLIYLYKTRLPAEHLHTRIVVY